MKQSILIKSLPSARIHHTTTARPRLLVVQSVGKDAIEGFFDLAKLVGADSSAKKTPFENLAYKIGKDVYVDVQGWHLFLKDMTATDGFKMHALLAQQFGPAQQAGRVEERDVEAFLRRVPVRLGGGSFVCLCLTCSLPRASVISCRFFKRNLETMIRMI